jgi:hypothetical protein
MVLNIISINYKGTTTSIIGKASERFDFYSIQLVCSVIFIFVRLIDLGKIQNITHIENPNGGVKTIHVSNSDSNVILIIQFTRQSLNVKTDFFF